MYWTRKLKTTKHTWICRIPRSILTVITGNNNGNFNTIFEAKAFRNKWLYRAPFASNIVLKVPISFCSGRALPSAQSFSDEGLLSSATPGRSPTCQAPPSHPTSAGSCMPITHCQNRGCCSHKWVYSGLFFSNTRGLLHTNKLQVRHNCSRVCITLHGQQQCRVYYQWIETSVWWLS